MILGSKSRWIVILAICVVLFTTSARSMADVERNHCDLGASPGLSQASTHANKVSSGVLLSGRDKFEEPIMALMLNASATSKLLDKVTRRLVSGELWESTTKSVFRYWRFGAQLQNFSGIVAGEGWENRSNIFKTFMDSSNCGSLTGRYAIVTPYLDGVTEAFLQTISGTTSPKPTIFAGCAGTSTALHYDSSRNFFLQLRGTKRFVLYSPQFLRSLYFAPSSHPYYRQSLIEPENLVGVDYDKYPRAATVLGHGIVAELRPGEVLLIPEYWSHYVISSSDDSVGLAMRWPLESMTQDALYRIPLAFELGWNVQDKYQVLNDFLSHILTAANVSENSLRERWFVAFGGLSKRPDLQNPEIDPHPLLDETSKQGYIYRGRNYALEVLQVLDKFHSKHLPVRDLLLLIYCEDVVMTVLDEKEALHYMLFGADFSMDRAQRQTA